MLQHSKQAMEMINKIPWQAYAITAGAYLITASLLCFCSLCFKHKALGFPLFFLQTLGTVIAVGILGAQASQLEA